MGIFTIDMANMLVDFIGLCFCVISLLYLVKNKTLLKEAKLKRCLEPDSASFNTEIFFQQLQLECENAFKTLADHFSSELKNIDGLIKQRKLGYVKKEPFKKKNQGKLDTVYLKNDRISTCDHVVKPYMEVIKLFNMGLSIDKIAKQVKLPKGEIEQIFRLKGKCFQQGEKFA